jgi:hypothetical protein
MNDEDLSSHFLLENPNLLFVKQSFFSVDFEASSETKVIRMKTKSVNYINLKMQHESEVK